MPGMIASNCASLNFAFRPIVSASAVTRSGSIPMIVCPSEARNSLGAYWASVPTTSVPLDLIDAGTLAAIAATVPVPLLVVVVGVLEFVVVELLLPHPAIARTASTGTPMRARKLIIETRPPPDLSPAGWRRPRKYRSASRALAQPRGARNESERGPGCPGALRNAAGAADEAT